MASVTLNPNQLYYTMLEFMVGSKERPVEIINLGGSSAAKSYDFFHLAFTLCANYRVKNLPDGDLKLSPDGDMPLVVHCFRNTLDMAKNACYYDALNVLRLMGIFDMVEKTEPTSLRPKIKFPNGSIVEFFGLPEFEGQKEWVRYHIGYFNEIFEVEDKGRLKSIITRCRIANVYDSNPKLAEHWIIDQINPNNKRQQYNHLIYRDNKFVPKEFITFIESECPWDLKDFVYDEVNKRWGWTKPISERLPNIKNIEAGTVDKRHWLIYGEGERYASEGQVFDDVNFISSFPNPEIFDDICFGLDFGWNKDECSLSINGKKDNSITSHCLIYEPVNHPEKLCDMCNIAIKGVYPQIDNIPEGTYVFIFTDSQDKFDGKQFVTQMNIYAARKGYKIRFHKVKKSGSKLDRALNLKRFKWNVVYSSVTKREISKYIYKEIGGKPTNMINERTGRNNFDHFIDSVVYPVWMLWRYAG
jgi:hypothetical protein